MENEATDRYRTRYAALTQRSLDHLLAQAQALGDLSPDAETHNRALHTLRQSLAQDDIWRAVRPVLQKLTPRIEQAGHWAEWSDLLEAALARSRRAADAGAEAFLLYHLGILYRLQNRYPAAEQALTASAQRYSELGDAAGRVLVQGRHAYLAWTRRDFGRARHLAAESLAQSDEQPESGDVYAYAHLVLGALAFETGDWSEAHVRFQAAHLLWQQHGNRRMAGTALYNRALALQQMGRYDEAVVIYRQAIDLLHAIGDNSGWAIAHMNLGILYRRQQAHDTALECYRRAEEVFRRMENRLLLARVHNNTGEVYRDLGRWEEAERAYRFSIEGWQLLGNVAEQINTLDNRIACLLAQNRFSEARHGLDEAFRLLNEIVDDPAHKRLSATLADKQFKNEFGF